MKYIPKYEKGQILVRYNPPVSDGFAVDFGERFNCKLIEANVDHTGAFLYSVSKGTEKDAIEKLEHYDEFVEWAERRDVKLEARWNGLEELVGEVRDLLDDVRISDDEYKTKLDRLTEKVAEIKSYK